jgi:hypothetical protein
MGFKPLLAKRGGLRGRFLTPEVKTVWLLKKPSPLKGLKRVAKGQTLPKP